MNILKKIYHFLGSIYFAVTLIGTVAFFVIVGTFIESYTESHRYAASLTYGSPLFKVLLWCFFINILFSSLRRWPFKWSHGPFLITHLGLLMILSGCLIKSYWGTQGTMLLVEGSGSHEIFLPDTYVVKIEKKDPKNAFGLISGIFDIADGRSPFPELEIQIADYSPNASEKLETWIKGDQLFLSGLPQGWTASHELTNDIVEVAKSEYLKDLVINFKDTRSDKTVYQGPINHDMRLDFNPESPKLVVEQAFVEVPLNGSEALLNKNTKYPMVGKSSITVDLQQKPKLLFLQNSLGEIHLYVFGPHGDIRRSVFSNEALQSLIVYDRGFGGYAVQEQITSHKSRAELENETHKLVKDELQHALDAGAKLSPPLEILYEACRKSGSDFSETCMQFLVNWENAGSWLYPENGPVFGAEDHIEIPSSLAVSCEWSNFLFDDANPIKNLELKNCPIPDADKPLTKLTQQLFAAADILPKGKDGNARLARLLSAIFRAYEIHLSDIRPVLPNEKEVSMIEAPITLRQEDIPAVKKIEDNLPKITLKMKKGEKGELVTLVYNRFESGVKVPAFDGDYVLRFQPKSESIPYRLRLRNARQINYANSSQPFSYESDLVITNRHSQDSVEKTISMNRVHETWEGYRFYLSNISPATETAVKRVQLAVNHDPAKYYLTYPGGCVVTLGSTLLFWRRKRKR